MLNAFNYRYHDNDRPARAKEFCAAEEGVSSSERQTFSAGRDRGNAGTGWEHPTHGREPLRTMNIMRATSALCLLLLSGCAAGMQQPHEITLRPRPKILR